MPCEAGGESHRNVSLFLHCDEQGIYTYVLSLRLHYKFKLHMTHIWKGGYITEIQLEKGALPTAFRELYLWAGKNLFVEPKSACPFDCQPFWAVAHISNGVQRYLPDVNISHIIYDDNPGTFYQTERFGSTPEEHGICVWFVERYLYLFV